MSVIADHSRSMVSPPPISRTCFDRHKDRTVELTFPLPSLFPPLLPVPSASFSCGKVVGNLWESYLTLLNSDMSEGYVRFPSSSSSYV